MIKQTLTRIKIALKLNHLSFLVYFLTLLTGMILTVVQYQNYRQSEEERIQSRFALIFNETNEAIIEKVLTYKQVLRATQGFFYASDNVSREQFKIFYQSLKLDKYYPGILGLGYVPFIEADSLVAHEAEVQATGFPEYKVKPSGEREYYSSILYLEPFEGSNLRAFGYDMFSEPVRNQAMQYARKTGSAALSAGVALVQDGARESQTGLLLYLPLYDPDLPVDASEEMRQAAFNAWVYAVFRVNDLVLPVITAGNSLHSLEIYQGTEHDASKLLFQSVNSKNLIFQLEKSYQIGGQEWTFVASPDDDFIAYYQGAAPKKVLWIGSLLTLLLAALLSSLITSRKRALVQAERMTKSLQQSSQRLILATQVAGIGVWEWDFNTNTLILDKNLFDLLEMDQTAQQEISLKQWLNLLPEKAQQIFEQAVVDTVVSGKRMDLQIKMLPEKNSSPVMVQLHAELHLDDMGNTKGLLGVCYDISDEWQHQRNLQETEARWKHALEGNGEGVWDWHIPDGRVLYSNRFVTMLGFEPDEFAPCLSECSDRIHPDDLQQVMDDIAKLLSGSQPNYHNEHRLQCKDGSWKWILARGSVIERDKQGNAIRVVGTHSDIDWRKHAELALRQSEERFRDAFDTAPIGMALVATDGRWLEVNDSLCEMLGYSESELLQKTFAEITHPDDLALDQYFVDKLLQCDLNHYKMEKRYICNNGDTVDVLLSVSAVHDEDGFVAYFVSQIEDITARKAEHNRVQQLAFYDALTGLPNRRLFEERFSHSLMALNRNSKTLALMFIDLDYFKQTNDEFGHDAGDYVLKTVGERILLQLRSTDTLARLGGDEFVVLLEDVNNAESALKIAENLRIQMQKPFTFNGDVLHVSLSIGIAVSSSDNKETPKTLMKKADIALYEVKAAGRNGVKLYREKH